MHLNLYKMLSKASVQSARAAHLQSGTKGVESRCLARRVVPAQVNPEPNALSATLLCLSELNVPVAGLTPL